MTMKGNKRVILHIIFDTIFFDMTSERFDEMDGYINYYLYRSYKEGYPVHFSYIKNVNKVVTAKDEKEWKEIITNPEIDIIYFHGMWLESLECFKYIPRRVIVIWWCFGREIYENCWGFAPLLSIKYLKPKTYFFKQKMIIGDFRQLFLSNFEYFNPSFFDRMRLIRAYNRNKFSLIKKMLERVDYIFTPLPIEYEMLKKKVKYLKAKPFRLYPSSIIKYSPVHHNEVGGGLFDHSAMLTNNHLDLLHALKKIDLSGRKIYVPLNYGDKRVRDEMKKHCNFCNSETIFIENPLSFNEYKELVSNCTHALFGAIRQCALGNIYLCFQLGVKVFFFKDSILYRFFKEEGYIVFLLDNLTQDSIQSPLTEEEIAYNRGLYYNKFDNRESYNKQFDKLIEEHNLN